MNTLDDRYSSAPKELLATYIDLARFGEDARILSDLQVDRLFTMSQQHPDTAERVRASAIRMREAMYEVLWAIVQRKPVPKAALMVLNGYIQEAAGHVDLVPGKGRMEWRLIPLPAITKRRCGRSLGQQQSCLRPTSCSLCARAHRRHANGFSSMRARTIGAAGAT